MVILTRFSRLLAGRSLTKNSSTCDIPWIRPKSSIGGQVTSKLVISSSSTKSSECNAAATWVDRFPPKIRPYLYLTRIDKPIGTLLLFYPCSASSEFQVVCPLQLILRSPSLVYNYGLVCLGSATNNAFDLPRTFWTWSNGHARCRLHHQRHVG